MLKTPPVHGHGRNPILAIMARGKEPKVIEEAQDVLDQYGPQVLLAEADRVMDHAKSEWDNPDLSSGEYLAGLRSAEAEAERLRSLARSEG